MCVLDSTRPATSVNGRFVISERHVACPAPAFDRPRQTLHRAPPGRLRGCTAAGALCPVPQGAGAADRHPHCRPSGCTAADGRDGFLCAGFALCDFSGLGDAALRHLLAAPGFDLGAPGDAVAHAAGCESRDRCGRGAAARCDGADASGPALFPGGLHLSLQAETEAERSRTEVAADPGGLQPCEPGGLARRVRGARRFDRPVPDGLAGALPGGPVWRRGGLDPHL